MTIQLRLGMRLSMLVAICLSALMPLHATNSHEKQASKTDVTAQTSHRNGRHSTSDSMHQEFGPQQVSRRGDRMGVVSQGSQAGGTKATSGAKKGTTGSVTKWHQEFGPVQASRHAAMESKRRTSGRDTAKNASSHAPAKSAK